MIEQRHCALISNHMSGLTILWTAADLHLCRLLSCTGLCYSLCSNKCNTKQVSSTLHPSHIHPPPILHPPSTHLTGSNTHTHTECWFSFLWKRVQGKKRRKGWKEEKRGNISFYIHTWFNVWTVSVSQERWTPALKPRLRSSSFQTMWVPENKGMFNVHKPQQRWKPEREGGLTE